MHLTRLLILGTQSDTTVKYEHKYRKIALVTMVTIDLYLVTMVTPVTIDLLSDSIIPNLRLKMVFAVVIVRVVVLQLRRDLA